MREWLGLLLSFRRGLFPLGLRMTHTSEGCKHISSARPALPSFLDKSTSERLWFCFLFTAPGVNFCQGDSSEPQNPPKKLSLLRNCPKDAFFRFGFPRVGRQENEIADSHLCLLLPRSSEIQSNDLRRSGAPSCGTGCRWIGLDGLLVPEHLGHISASAAPPGLQDGGRDLQYLHPDRHVPPNYRPSNSGACGNSEVG